MEVTITHNNAVQGFPSFYSFTPEFMISLNNQFYSFKGGELYIHDNELSDDFYNQEFNVSLQTVFNDVPLENKIFKTISIEGTQALRVDLTSDLQATGYIEQEWFEKKENSYFSFIRNSESNPITNEFNLRAISGIGVSQSVTGTTTQVIKFPPSISVESAISVGDKVYSAIAPQYDSPVFRGVITLINRVGDGTEITIDTTSGSDITNQNDFCMYIKNSVAESNGILGHYGVITLSGDSNSDVELFAINAEIMKSNP